VAQRQGLQATSRTSLCFVSVLAACSASEPERNAARDAAAQEEADAHTVEHEPVDVAPMDGGSERADGAAAGLDAAQQSALPDAAGAQEAAAGLVRQSWPTPDTPVAVDQTGLFANNLSALAYEPARGSTPARLWAAQNEPPTLYRLLWDGTLWNLDAAGGWARGKTLRFPSGDGRPDAEGMTLLAGAAGARFLYVASERNTDSAAARQSVLRFDVSTSGAALTATHEWNLTSAIAQTGLNMGVEAIAFVPDSAAAGLFDESRMRGYDPGAYAEHAGGLFFVGVEATGAIHAFLLDHAGGGATRIATIDSGMPGVMALEYDADNALLWAHCDQVCDNLTTLLELERGSGRFVVRRELTAPPGTKALGNEGFAIVPDAECSGGRKSIFWAEDAATGGHAIRRGSAPCGREW
jgi:hypothetical protein